MVEHDTLGPDVRRVQPATLKRVADSVWRGALRGVGIAALAFGVCWLMLDPGDGSLPFSGFWALLLAVEAWMWVRGEARGRRYLYSAVAAMLAIGGIAVFAYWMFVTRDVLDWLLANKELATLALVSMPFGVAVIGWSCWKQDGVRVVTWFAAAAALWFASEWTVQLGPPLQESSDPRYALAQIAFFGAGALCVAGVFAFMNWRLRWTDQQERDRIEREEVRHG